MNKRQHRLTIATCLGLISTIVPTLLPFVWLDVHLPKGNINLNTHIHTLDKEPHLQYTLLSSATRQVHRTSMVC